MLHHLHVKETTKIHRHPFIQKANCQSKWDAEFDLVLPTIGPDRWVGKMEQILLWTTRQQHQRKAAPHWSKLHRQTWLLSPDCEIAVTLPSQKINCFGQPLLLNHPCKCFREESPENVCRKSPDLSRSCVDTIKISDRREVRGRKVKWGAVPNRRIKYFHFFNTG